MPATPERSAPVDSANDVTSAGWAGPPPSISVVVPTHDHALFLGDLIAALEMQTCPRADFEVVMVDDASTDGTWDLLRGVVYATPLRLRVVRLDANQGPGTARNTGAALSRGDVLVFTDDDCIPSSMWLEALALATAGGSDAVQGRTLPDPAPASTAWPRSVWITGPTPLFESCNLAIRREAFERAGGFGTDRPRIPDRTRRHFGEDAEVGWRIRSAGGRIGYAPGALVHHRQLPATYADWLDEQRRMALFPRLVRRIPGLGREMLRFGVFLNERTALFDLAVTGATLAVTLRRPWIVAAALPWLRARWRDTRWKPGRPRLVRLAQFAVGDAVGLASLVQGSIRNRRLVV